MSHGKPDYFATYFEEDFVGVGSGTLNVTVPASGEAQMFRITATVILNNVSGNAISVTLSALVFRTPPPNLTPQFASISSAAAGTVMGGAVFPIWTDSTEFEVTAVAAGFGVGDTYDLHVKVEGM